MTAPVEIAILGDLHGSFDELLDGPVLSRFPLGLCTGDLTPNRGRDRFDVAMRIGSELASLGVRTVLGNHDGPACFTGRAFPKSYLSLCEVLGAHHLAGRLEDFPELGVSIIGARPLSTGGPELKYRVPGREMWTFEQWGAEIAALARQATQPRLVVLAHCGPTGLGSLRDAPYGCDFRVGEGDWGDRDLRLALDSLRAEGVAVAAVVAGHMHHVLNGGGQRVRVAREHETLHVNAAVVPRVTEQGRAIVVLRLDGQSADARLEWHRPDGSIQSEELT